MQNNNDILKAQSPAALAEEYIVKAFGKMFFLRAVIYHQNVI